MGWSVSQSKREGRIETPESTMLHIPFLRSAHENHVSWVCWNNFPEEALTPQGTSHPHQQPHKRLLLDVCGKGHSIDW